MLQNAKKLCEDGYCRLAHKVMSTSIGCGIPPFEILDPDFIFFPACATHDKAYLETRRRYLLGEINLLMAEKMIKSSDKLFASHIKSLYSNAPFYYKWLGRSFIQAVNAFGWAAWKYGTRQELG